MFSSNPPAALAGGASEPSSVPSSAKWRLVLESSPDTRIDLESAIGSFFVGDNEFTKAVVDTIEKIMESGDMHKWAELKRLDTHAAKHQRIASDHLLNITCLLINRVCCLDGSNSCDLYRDIVYDRIENFHNQCRDEIPQSVSRFRAKFEYLHPYNVKSYQSILQLVGTYILKANLELANELGKRIASNHNHWFNFIHMIEFVRSLVDGINHPVAVDLLLVLGPEFLRIISGLCGMRLGYPSSTVTILESSGVSLSPSLVADGWIGSLLIDIIDVCRRSSHLSRSPQMFSSLISSCLNTLASLDTCLDRPLILNTIISMIPELVSSIDSIDQIACEFINFSLCFLIKCSIESDWEKINLESANQFILRLSITLRHSKNERLFALILKWVRAMVLGPLTHPGVMYVWKSLLALDSPVMEFVVDCIAPVTVVQASGEVGNSSDGKPKKIYTVERAITCYNAIEVVRAILVRDFVVPPHQGTSGFDALSITRNRPCGLLLIATEAFQLRRCRKICAYILHQCVIRNAKLVHQVLFETGDENAIGITENLARMMLDTKFEEEMDLFSLMDEMTEIDFDHLNNCESCNLDNFSLHSLISVNSLLESQFYYKLESYVERVDCPIKVNDRLEHWLVHNNPLAAVSNFSGVVYHAVSGRLMALALLYESSGFMTSSLLGLVETSIGVMNNDLHKELVGIDALFLLLNLSPPQESFDAQFEYLMALRVVNELLDNTENRNAVLRFIQYRWEHRFAIMQEMLNSEGAGLVQILVMTEFYKIASVELLVANQLVDTDAQHVANMREFGNALIVSDVSRGKFRILDFVVEATVNDEDLIVPSPKTAPFEIRDPRLVSANDGKSLSNLTIMKSQGVIDLVDSFVAVISQWSETFSDKQNVIQNMLESVAIDSSSLFFKFCWYSRIVPKLLLLSGGGIDGGNSLAFNLRMLKSLVAEFPATDDASTKAGLVEAIALCLVGFSASTEVWMIDKDAVLLRSIVEIVFSFSHEMTRNQNRLVDHKNSVLLAMNVLLSFVATDRPDRRNIAVDVVKNSLVNKPFSKISDPDLASLITELNNLVDNDILFRELGI